jgi:Raf kinase inhibitor-like YbhB/YbcL family protein
MKFSDLVSIAASTALLCAGARAAEFKLTSTDVSANRPLAKEFVFNGYGCNGGNISPALSWSGAPAGTKSYAVALFDPDAMQGRGFWHWLMLNIPAETKALARDAGRNDGSKAPAGSVQLKNGFRATGYSGSCPPTSDEPHGYVMTVYALRVDRLAVAGDATCASMLALIEGASLAKDSLIFHFGRKDH